MNKSDMKFLAVILVVMIGAVLTAIVGAFLIAQPLMSMTDQAFQLVLGLILINIGVIVFIGLVLLFAMLWIFFSNMSDLSEDDLSMAIRIAREKDPLAKLRQYELERETQRDTQNDLSEYK